MHTPWIGVVVVLAVLLTPATALPFYNITYYGTPINYCPTVSGSPTDCEPLVAASLYCQRSGYDRAITFSGPVNATSTVAMQLMLDGKPRPVWNTTGGVMERCEAKDGKTCSALGMVDCIDDKMYTSPKVDGKPLDWCTTTANGTTECGRKVAWWFCARNGALHGTWAWNGPTDAELGTVSLDLKDFKGPVKTACDGKQGECKTFFSINCAS